MLLLSLAQLFLITINVNFGSGYWCNQSFPIEQTSSGKLSSLNGSTSLLVIFETSELLFFSSSERKDSQVKKLEPPLNISGDEIIIYETTIIYGGVEGKIYLFNLTDASNAMIGITVPGLTTVSLTNFQIADNHFFALRKDSLIIDCDFPFTSENITCKSLRKMTRGVQTKLLATVLFKSWKYLIWEEELSIIVFDINTQTVLSTLNHPEPYFGCLIPLKGTMQIASCGIRRIYIWDLDNLETSTLIDSLEIFYLVSFIEYYEKGNILIVGSSDKSEMTIFHRKDTTKFEKLTNNSSFKVNFSYAIKFEENKLALLKEVNSGSSQGELEIFNINLKGPERCYDRQQSEEKMSVLIIVIIVICTIGGFLLIIVLVVIYYCRRTSRSNNFLLHESKENSSSPSQITRKTPANSQFEINSQSHEIRFIYLGKSKIIISPFLSNPNMETRGTRIKSLTSQHDISVNEGVSFIVNVNELTQYQIMFAFDIIQELKHRFPGMVYEMITPTEDISQRNPELGSCIRKKEMISEGQHFELFNTEYDLSCRRISSSCASCDDESKLIKLFKPRFNSFLIGNPKVFVEYVTFLQAITKLKLKSKIPYISNQGVVFNSDLLNPSLGLLEPGLPHSLKSVMLSFIQLERKIFYAQRLITYFQHLHSKGYSHGNIKASNIFLDENLTDLNISGGGLLKILGIFQTNRKTTDETYLYSIQDVPMMAPELINAIFVENSSVPLEAELMGDIWSLGLLLYQLFYEENPERIIPWMKFCNEGDVENFGASYNQAVQDDLKPVGSKYGLPFKITQLVGGCLSIHVSERISLNELEEALLNITISR